MTSRLTLMQGRWRIRRGQRLVHIVREDNTGPAATMCGTTISGPYDDGPVNCRKCLAAARERLAAIRWFITEVPFLEQVTH